MMASKFCTGMENGMNNRIVISLVLIGLFSVSNAYAMTSMQAKQLAMAAYKRDTVDLIALESAAKSGDSNAQFWLGAYWIAKKDYAKANQWFEKAAAQGNADAENSLGNAYYHGYGVFQDYAKANYWYEKAAAQGNVDAENNIGSAYAEGQGMPQNYVKAIHWYKKAAENGNVSAEYNIGVLYNYGHGVPQNTKTAIKWWKKAAVQGGEYGEMAQHDINAVDGKVSSESDHYLSLVDLFKASPYANKGKKYHIYFSKVVQSISKHDDLLDFQGSYYMAKFKGYAPQKGDFISGYCYGLGATQYQSVTNELEVVPHVLFYQFNAYNLGTPYGQEMSITLLKEQIFEGMSEMSSTDTESKASISALHSLATLSPNAADRAVMRNRGQRLFRNAP